MAKPFMKRVKEFLEFLTGVFALAFAGSIVAAFTIDNPTPAVLLAIAAGALSFGFGWLSDQIKPREVTTAVVSKHREW